MNERDLQQVTDCKAAVALDALSAGQQRIVQSHLKLVSFTLRREPALWRSTASRERRELVQEGSLALVEALRSHDPARHGSFAPYAMSRIHFAVSRWAHENESLIRVPFITQRRRRRRSGDDEASSAGDEDRHRPQPLPRVVPLRNPRAPARQRAAAVLRNEDRDSGGARSTVGEVVRERLDRAVERIADEMKKSPLSSPPTRELIDRCLAERWTIPEAEARTPIRELARAIGCSIGRVTHCEDRFRRRTAALLDADEVFRRALALARRRPLGLDHPLTAQEEETLDRVPRS